MSVRDRLLASAIARMRRDGVAGTGISDLIADACVARRSVYLNFPGGKGELVTEATATAGRLITGYISALSAKHSPGQAISAFVAQWRRDLVTSDFHAGCPIMAAALGRPHAPAAADTAAAIFAQWSELLAAALRDAGIDAESSADLGQTAIATIEGAILMCVAMRSTEPLTRAERMLTRMIDTAHALP